MLTYKSMLFFILIFGIIIYGYIYYEHIMSSSLLLQGVKIFLIGITILSITFPHVMDYFKYSDNKNISLEDILLFHHSSKK
jgi:hypothetical protein